ncbi:MAG: cytochrome c biogenesis protein CcdA [Pseudomonadota bacterium]
MMADAYIYAAVAFAGLVSFLSPCVLPLVPPYLGYLGGTTISQTTADEGVDNAVWRRIVIGSVFFVLGFSTVFIGLGAGASVFGQVLQEYKETLSMIAGAIIILFGLHFMGVLRVPVLFLTARFDTNVQGASYLGAFVIGLAFAFGWTPCIGPILAAVLTLAASEGSLTTGVGYLAAYSLGLGVPFVLAAVAIGPFMDFMRRFRSHLGKVEMVMGLILVVTGILFLTGTITWIGQWMLETFPALAELEGALTPEGLQQDIRETGLPPAN